LFVLLMTLKIDINQNRVRHDEFQTFVKGKPVYAIHPDPECL